MSIPKARTPDGYLADLNLDGDGNLKTTATLSGNVTINGGNLAQENTLADILLLS